MPTRPGPPDDCPAGLVAHGGPARAVLVQQAIMECWFHGVLERELLLK
ncbi:hypothetical protein [Streptomyces sp. S186]